MSVSAEEMKSERLQKVKERRNKRKETDEMRRHSVSILKKELYHHKTKSYELQVQSNSTLFVLLTVISSTLPVTAHSRG